MNDPHVVSLTYRIVPGDEVRYSDASPIEIDTVGFRGCLEDEILRLEPKHHYPSLDLARLEADRFVRGWELDARLREGRPALEFEYVTGELIDRDPPPPGGSKVMRVKAAGLALVAGSVTLCVTRRSYPQPPADFEFTKDVETLWNRLEGYRAGREPLPSMAYFCLTWIEGLAGGRSAAAQLLNIDKAVLSKLGDLTANRGDAQTARKVSRSAPLQELTERETRWIVACLEAVIRRVGETSTAMAKQLTLADLPGL